MEPVRKWRIETKGSETSVKIWILYVIYFISCELKLRLFIWFCTMRRHSMTQLMKSHTVLRLTWITNWINVRDSTGSELMQVNFLNIYCWGMVFQIDVTQERRIWVVTVQRPFMQEKQSCRKGAMEDIHMIKGVRNRVLCNIAQQLKAPSMKFGTA